MTNNKKPKKDVCSVAIHADGRLYLYPCFSSNHRQALDIAVANHKQVWGPLPSNFRGLEDGPCHESDCNCGKQSIMEVTQSAESEDLGLTN